MPGPAIRRVGALVFGLAAVGAGGLALRAEQQRVNAELGRPRDLHGAAFAGAAECARCHPEHVASWRRTFHRTMTQDVSPAHPEVVAGDFSGVTHRYGDVEARMHRDGAGRFLMTFQRRSPPAASPVDAVVVRAVGSRRYQQYLAQVGDTLWRLPLAFHVEDKRWFHMNGAFLTPDPDGQEPVGSGGPAAPGHPSFGGGVFDYDRHVTRWNDNCVFCHNVGANPGSDPRTGAFRTTVAELGIACEACHGPGAEHVRVNANPVRRYLLHGSPTADPTIVNPSRLTAARAADLCGRCHGQRISDDLGPFLQHGDPFVPGDDLGLYSSPLWNDTALRGDRRAFAARFWDDGTARLTAYEYQGLLQSRCAQLGGLTCISCHGMHDGDPRGQVRPAAAGDRACTRCHAGLAPAGAVSRHTRHRPDGPGARCVSCHMPRVVYGVLDVHPSHRIERPDPAGASAAGRPDACTLCHVEEDRAWAIRERARLWPPAVSAAAPPAEPRVESAPRAAAFGGDPIARAVAVDALGRAPLFGVGAGARDGGFRARATTLLEVVAQDRYPAVRQLAARALVRVLEGSGHDEEAALVRTYEATAPPEERTRVVADIRGRLVPACGADPHEAARAQHLRTLARQVDIDIGE